MEQQKDAHFGFYICLKSSFLLFWLSEVIFLLFMT